MKVCVLSINPSRRNTALAGAAADFLERLQPYTTAESRIERSEEGVFQPLKASGRTPPRIVLLDSRGKQLSSEELAAWIGRERDSGAQQLIFAIGPADGWSAAARAQAHLLLSFGPMTFPHELARVMLTEQLYRAFTILSGHPYHSGH